jgi:GT2 family glycosyltransferase
MDRKTPTTQERGMSPRVGAVVVAWRSLEPTVEALRSLLRSTVAIHPVVCVAQEYSDSELKRLADVLTGHELIRVDENLGFATGANIGIARALELGADWVLLLNNDALADPLTVDHCLAEARQHERVAEIAPAIVYAHNPNRLWFAGTWRSDWLGLSWPRGYFTSASRVPPSAETADIPGCCVLVSAEAWRSVGPFREDFFMYYEDTEWSDRARRGGWHLRYLGEVLCQHAMAASTGQNGSRYLTAFTAYYMTRNPMRYSLDSAGARRVTRTLAVLTIWLGYNFTRIKPSEWSTVGRAMFRGLIDALLGNMGRRDPLTGRQVPAGPKS